jgi:hypothetical protein
MERTNFTASPGIKGMIPPKNTPNTAFGASAWLFKYINQRLPHNRITTKPRNSALTILTK